MKVLLIAGGVVLALLQPVLAGDICADTPVAQLSPDDLAYCRQTRALRWGAIGPETLTYDRTTEERRAAVLHNDPGAVSLCPPPHHLTRDGCQ